MIASGSETDIVAGQEESKTEVKDPEHPLIPDPSPALNHMPTVNLDRVSSSVEETEHVWHAFTRHDADFRGTLQAEKCIMRLEYCSFFDMLTGAVLQGTLVMTNYQIFFEPYDEAHLVGARSRLFLWLIRTFFPSETWTDVGLYRRSFGND